MQRNAYAFCAQKAFTVSWKKFSCSYPMYAHPNFKHSYDTDDTAAYYFPTPFAFPSMSPRALAYFYISSLGEVQLSRGGPQKLPPNFVRQICGNKASNVRRMRLSGPKLPVLPVPLQISIFASFGALRKGLFGPREWISHGFVSIFSADTAL